MNEKTTKQIEEMMNQTIGVEVEMNNITRTKAAELAAEFFGTGRHEHTAGRNGYDTYSAWDGEGREWKFQKDVSIHGTGQRKVRNGHPDTHLRRHGNPAGAYPQTSQSRREKRRNKGLRSSHSHRSQGSHAAKSAKPRKHNGKPRKPACKRLEPRQKPHEPLLPHGQQGFPGGTQPQKAENNGGACGHLVRQSERGLRQVGALQREPLPYAEPPRNLYKGYNRVSALPV